MENIYKNRKGSERDSERNGKIKFVSSGAMELLAPAAIKALYNNIAEGFYKLPHFLGPNIFGERGLTTVNPSDQERRQTSEQRATNVVA